MSRYYMNFKITEHKKIKSHRKKYHIEICFNHIYIGAISCV